MSIFQNVQARVSQRTAFDLSHERKLSLDMGNLVPIFCQEVVPGDTFRLNSEILLRLAPMIAPVMHRVDVYTHYFFVPNRLIFKGWEDFITGGEDGLDDTVAPRIRLSSLTSPIEMLGNGTLADYLGLPDLSGLDGVVEISALPFRAYQLIYNEYYRDENLIPKRDFSIDPGVISDPDEIAILLGLNRRAWEKDYFTSALPFAQKGAAMTIPVTGSAPVVLSDRGKMGTDQQFFNFNHPSSDDPLLASSIDSTKQALYNDTTSTFLNIDPNNTLFADLSEAAASTINDLRKAFQIQTWLERNARAGSRYIESILAHFGVRSSDARLQRPEYLGGGKAPVVISEVLQTSQSDTTPQGNMAGRGSSVGNTNSFKAFFEEHGFVIGIVSVLPRTSYQQGLSRTWIRFDKFDYFWPEFAHLGEQEVKNHEVYMDPHINEDNDKTFGYQARYSEYKYIPSTVHGDFKSSLNYWHMGRIFASRPSLNGNFVTSNPTTRIFAVTSESVPHLYAQVYNNVQAIRPMPLFGEPGYIDHP